MNRQTIETKLSVSCLKPQYLKNRNTVGINNFIAIKKGVKVNDPSYKDLTETDVRNILIKFYELLQKEVLKGQDYKLPRIGKIGIRWQKRKGSIKIKSYFNEVYEEFLDKKLVCILRKDKYKNNKHLVNYSFKVSDAIKVPMMQNVINKGYESVYIQDGKL